MAYNNSHNIISNVLATDIGMFTIIRYIANCLWVMWSFKMNMHVCCLISLFMKLELCVLYVIVLVHIIASVCAHIHDCVLQWYSCKKLDSKCKMLPLVGVGWRSLDSPVM